MTDILQKNWLIARLLEKRIKSSLNSAKGTLLDVGCGNLPYRAMFRDSVLHYDGIDLPASPLIDRNIDILGSAQELPFKEKSFDFILCTEVLQYLPEPQKAMREFHRILKDRGKLILTTTQMWHVTNPPYDCYRFTRYGLRYLMQSSGLRIKHIEALGGFWLRMGLKFCYFSHRMARSSSLRMFLSIMLILPQLFFLAMDRIFFNPKDVIDHYIVAIKDS